MLSKVLAIDDSASIHALLSVHFQGEPIELRSAYDGETALWTINKWCPDLILLDVDMPGMDGFEVYSRLRENVLTINIPVIFLTSSAATDQKVWGLDLGASDYITKPFEPKELLARVRAALRSKSRMDFLAGKRAHQFIAEALRPRGVPAGGSHAAATS
jgi:DNA-binding response OmpR family regulator